PRAVARRAATFRRDTRILTVEPATEACSRKLQSRRGRCRSNDVLEARCREVQLTHRAGSSKFRCSPAAHPHSFTRHGMQSLLYFLHALRDPRALVAWGGYVGLTIIIFAETGLLVGFFLPGDSLLVTAGLLASQGDRFDLNVYVLGVLLSVASIL